MTDQPKRPLHPDEEPVRFHNGNTLDNMPVPPEYRPGSSRTPGWKLAVAAVGSGVLGALVIVGIGSLMDSGPREPVSRPGAAASAAVERKPSVSPSTQVRPSAAAEVEVKAAPLEQVRIIQTPPTGGDAGSTYCLSYTGSSSGAEREAILLMGAAGYQCDDHLRFDPSGETSAFSTTAPECGGGSRPAVLSFAETGGWEGEVMYTCLTGQRGA
ncbi:hypothetical protein OG711_26840 [Streptomyces uncialis]|uniref:hypothetical protein n=1 Tax=Streptomyces uncialis TaxID=1048205 RepID=UPI002E34701F|nr:hypothetical protein [Streptomyces uncialis]